MTEHALSTLLTALDIAAFERDGQGGFRPLAPLPMWFSLLSRDGTFPFLGHILEEATAFWKSDSGGSREWGPCAEVNESGQEFHYRVKALRLYGHSYLVFQIDEAAEQMRQVLQKVRSDALAEEQKSRDK